MGLTKIEVTSHVCDGCGKELLGEPGDVAGTSVSWMTVDGGGFGGTFWVCSDRCQPKAFRNRYEIEATKEGRN